MSDWICEARMVYAHPMRVSALISKYSYDGV